ncbi:MAG: hypothetical protein D6731_13445 [Planctomycetota bacterium]|nr:MAG: hypothetical protein D6731_13445 [Planctomycetota bacterium]
MIRITVYQGETSLGTGAYETDRVLLGSADDVDLKIEEPGVEEEHAEFFVSGGRLYVRKVGGGPLQLAGQEVERSEVRPGERLSFGGELALVAVYRKDQGKTTSVRRVEAISFTDVKTYTEEEIEAAAQSGAIDLTKSSSSGEAARPSASASQRQTSAEELEALRRKRLQTLAAAAICALVVGSVIYFAIVPTVQKYFFYEDDPLPR